MIVFPCCCKSRPSLQKEGRNLQVCPSKTRNKTRPKTDLNVSTFCLWLLSLHSTWLKQQARAGTFGAFAVVLHVFGEVHCLMIMTSPVVFKAQLSAFRDRWQRLNIFPKKNKWSSYLTSAFSMWCQQWCGFLLPFTGSLHMSEFHSSLWQRYPNYQGISCNSGTDEQWFSQAEVKGQ